MDNLDRTNVGQAAIAKWTLNLQLKAAGVLLENDTVDNYEELYPPNRWKDPNTYLKFSDTVEESVSYALHGGHIYYMDERDKEWLDKNNEEARGEGTSAQGALAGTSTRSSRSTKAKGKDPEVSQPAVMSEDEFELVVSLFEKVTHEKTEFLHHVRVCRARLCVVALSLTSVM